MEAKSERMQVLEMIESGQISADQGLALLQALAEAEAASEETEFSDALPLPEGMDSGAPTEWVAVGSDTTTAAAAIPLPAPAPEAAFSDQGMTVEASDERSVSDGRDSATGSLEPAAWEALPSESAASTGSDGPVETRWERLEPPAAEPGPSFDEQPASPDLPPDAARWRRWWAIPLLVGAAFSFWGGLFMYLALRVTGGIGLWFLGAAVPFALGLLVMALAFQSRTAPWLHLRVQQKPGARPQRIAISFPLPVGPTAWFLRTFGSYIPQVKENSLDEIILAVGRSATPENPIYIQVDEGDDGEKVEIYIG